MPETPDLSTLPKRMRYAASVLEESAQRSGVKYDIEYTPALLRADAAVFENEDREAAEHAAERAALASELARELVLHLQDLRRNPQWVALTLIESGWRKADPA
jgi:hypothetical protein